MENNINCTFRISENIYQAFLKDIPVKGMFC